MIKKFLLRGKELEELKKMSLDEFAEFVPSNMRRSLKLGLTKEQKNLLKEIEKNPNKFHKTHCRDMVIVPQMVGCKIGIYNGKEFIAVTIAEDMLGHRLGEFALTRKQVKHSSPGVGATKSSKYIPLK